MQRFGVVRFFAFFAVTAAAAAAFHALLNPTDVAVLVGASGAVSGLTAAAVRFAIGPGLLSGRCDWQRPAAPLAEALRDRQVLVFVAVWFGINLLAGLGAPFGGRGCASPGGACRRLRGRTAALLAVRPVAAALTPASRRPRLLSCDNLTRLPHDERDGRLRRGPHSARTERTSHDRRHYPRGQGPPYRHRRNPSFPSGGRAPAGGTPHRRSPDRRP